MPVDKNGKLFKEGDVVYIPCHLVEILSDDTVKVKLDGPEECYMIAEASLLVTK